MLFVVEEKKRKMSMIIPLKMLNNIFMFISHKQDDEFNGRMSARSDSDDDDDDLPPMIGKLNMIRNHSPLKATKNLY